MSCEWSVLINFQDGEGWVDLTEYETGGEVRNLVREDGFMRNRILHNGLRPVPDQLMFRIEHNRALVNKLFNAEQNVLVIVTRDAAAYFTGYFRPTAAVTIRKSDIDSPYEDDVVEIEALDNSWKLSRSHGWDGQSDVVLQNAYICNPAQPQHSVVHQILIEAGYTETERSQITDTIDNQINSFTLFANRYPTDDDERRKQGTKYGETIEKLLYEYGYLYFFDEAGRFQLYRWAVDELSATGTLGHADAADEIQIEQTDDDVDKIDVEYNEVASTTERASLWSNSFITSFVANDVVLDRVCDFQTQSRTVLRIYDVVWWVKGETLIVSGW